MSRLVQDKGLMVEKPHYYFSLTPKGKQQARLICGLVVPKSVFNNKNQGAKK